MVRFLLVVALLFAVVLGFERLKDTPGELALTVGGRIYAVDLSVAVLAALLALAAGVVAVLLLRLLLRSPGRTLQRWREGRREKGRAALSDGLISVAAGDLRGAERAAQEARRRLPEAPLTRLLEAQTAQLKGDQAAARTAFAAMVEDPATRIVGLRGLHIEAERQGDRQAARHFAELARDSAGKAPWAARALLRYQAAEGDWDAALRTLSAVAQARAVDKKTARRQRAVLLAAKALETEDGAPETARQLALEAHDLAPDLVPAAIVAGRLLARLGEVRRAAKVLEATWKEFPHPDIAEVYVQLRAGDAARDRLKRAETLQRLRPQADIGRLALARAALDARDWNRAREALLPVIRTRPTQNALILMAEIEEAETGDRGRAREWLARAVRAPRDPVWIADGLVLEEWAPVSPASGRLDAVEWKVPAESLAGPATIDIDEAALRPPPAVVDAVPQAPPAAETPPAPAPQEEAPPLVAAPLPLRPAPAPAAVPQPAAPVAVSQPAATVAVPQPATSRSAAETPPAEGAPPAPPLEGLAGDAVETAPAAAPRLPDDPGVAEDEEERPEPQRFRLFGG